MYVVIFTAEIAELDDAYQVAAARMRNLACEKYGCRGFTSAAEGNREIAISYWDDEEAIAAWRQDVAHRAAQDQGRTKWYRHYRVDVAKIERSYDRTTPSSDRRSKEDGHAETR